MSDPAAEIEESLLAVPLQYGARVTGVIVISKLGLDQFDADDLRLLQVMAGHASVALENARLYESQRREAEGAKALLAFSRELAEASNIADVAERATTGAAGILDSPSTSVRLQNADTGSLERLASVPVPVDDKLASIPAEHSRRSSTARSRTRSIQRTMPLSRRSLPERRVASRSLRSR